VGLKPPKPHIKKNKIQQAFCQGDTPLK